MGAMQRGPNEGISGLIPGIIAEILGVAVFYLGLGRFDYSKFFISVWSSSWLAGIAGWSGHVSASYYLLPIQLIYGLGWRVLSQRSRGRPKDPAEDNVPPSVPDPRLEAPSLMMDRVEVVADNPPGISSKVEMPRRLVWFIIPKYLIVVAAVCGIAGALQRGPNEIISGIIPGIVAGIMGLGAFLLAVGEKKDRVHGHSIMAAYWHAIYAGRSGSVAAVFYLLPVPLIYGLVLHRLLRACGFAKAPRVQGPISAGSPGLWDSEMDGNRR